MHQIRQERKKQTAEQILQMKERQQKSERLRAAKAYTRNSMYIGVAVVIGATAVIIYRYFLWEALPRLGSFWHGVTLMFDF